MYVDFTHFLKYMVLNSISIDASSCDEHIMRKSTFKVIPCIQPTQATQLNHTFLFRTKQIITHMTDVCLFHTLSRDAIHFNKYCNEECSLVSHRPDKSSSPSQTNATGTLCAMSTLPLQLLGTNA